MNTTTPHKRSNWRKWRVIKGQGLVEYALIIVAVAIVIIAVLSFIGQVVFVNMYSRISSGFPRP